MAGGSGSRLYPMTSAINKHLLPIYDKPMIYYPLCTLMLAEIREILIISTPEDVQNFKALLGNGDRFGLEINYAIQPSPDGLAQAFIIGKDFIGSDEVAMILGDNIFVGPGMKDCLRKAKENVIIRKATIFGYQVKDPCRFGVIEFDVDGRVISIEEKPKIPKSNFAAAGLYFYDNRVVDFATKVKPSWRNELEITDVNNFYLEADDLEAIPLDDEYTWMDAGTPDAMIEAACCIQMIEKDCGVGVGYPEEIALLNGWVDRADLEEFIKKNANSDYGKYISGILEKEFMK